ncbi:MAG TPA: hypothetical protein VJN43_07750 [Bryobacteraceae bacterium]|nr:hypothetical protein [Bryobacteraceae bacterium]
MKRFAFTLLLAAALHAQVYSPRVLVKGQIDSSTLKTLADGIYRQAHAVTPREKAEAIWRFFLTDGRFVKPGFWYHIAGWAYEEPSGEVLDPVKLLNSYGFGLCYHIAPLLEAVYDAGGFEDARVWFLTGHTVTEVFYDGAYHYFDSDMLGYNSIGNGDPRRSPVASVHQIEQDGNIILSKLKGPRDVDARLVDAPWYPADVREGAMDGLAELFTTTQDNRLFPFKRYAPGHSMAFTLRPGERLIQYFRPEQPGLFYLPYKRAETGWEEFPQEVAEYQIKTADGPRSQKDARHWSTGRIEYTPDLSDPAAYESQSRGESVLRVESPYVIIDSQVSLQVDPPSEAQGIEIATSTDGGKAWAEARRSSGARHGQWISAPRIEAHTEHGTLTAVSGHYSYLVRIKTGNARLNRMTITTYFQMNPRTLPALAAGTNQMVYRGGPVENRREIPVVLDRIKAFALRAENVGYVSEHAQGFLAPDKSSPAEIVFELTAPDGVPIGRFEAGGRFLDIRHGEAPDKLTAEVRKTAYDSSVPPAERSASLAWSLAPDGSYNELWHYDPSLHWKDGIPIDRTLRWPEVFREVDHLPNGAKRVYVRYRLNGIALDSLRLAVVSVEQRKSPQVEVTHLWHEGNAARSHVERIAEPWHEHYYSVQTSTASPIVNDAVIYYCPPRAQP